MAFIDRNGYCFLGCFWQPKNWGNAGRILVTIAVGWYLGPIAYNFGYWGTASAALGAGASAATASLAGGLVGGALAGATVGAVTGGIFGGWDGVLQGAKYGAIGGAFAGPVAEYFGNNWSLSRVGAQSLAGGITSRVEGGSFADGFRSSFAMSSLTYANYLMRQDQVAMSKLFVDANGNMPNANGVSSGFFGDYFKLAGARITMLIDRLACTSSAGGCQGLPTSPNDDLPNILGVRYQSNGLLDNVSEAFAGPHDWFRNITGAYLPNGNSVYFTPGSAGAMWDSVKLWGEIPLAAPFAVGALLTTVPGAGTAFHY